MSATFAPNNEHPVAGAQSESADGPADWDTDAPALVPLTWTAHGSDDTAAPTSWSLLRWLEDAGISHLQPPLAWNGFGTADALARMDYADVVACGILDPIDQRALLTATATLHRRQ